MSGRQDPHRVAEVEPVEVEPVEVEPVVEPVVEPDAEPDAEPDEDRTEPVEDRTEEYDATRPDGTVVRVWHNIDTGETRVSD